MAKTTSFRSSLVLVAAIATAALVALLGLLHASDFQHHVTTRLAHHRALQALDAAPALQLLVHAKRDTMQIHGTRDFAVLVEPTTTTATASSDAFEFNALATIVEGEITHTYKLVDGVTYYTKTTTGADALNEPTAVVLPASVLPPVHELLAALAAATPLDAVETTQTIDCPTDSKRFHARFSDMDFVVCGVASGGILVVGEDFDVEIRTSSVHTAITKPTNVQPTTTTTTTTATATIPRSTRRVAAASLLSALTLATRDAVSRVLAPATTHARKLKLEAATCGVCKSTPRPCIFFHGMDIKADGGLVDDFAFFGDIKKHAPCCSSIKFAVLNTVDYGWNNASLVDKACAYALSMSPTSDATTGTIEDTIVVAHSMGNLLLAHAEATGKCQLGRSSSWVALSGPFTGSMGSDFQQQICEGDYFAKDLVAAVVTLFGQCPPSRARAALTYEGGNFSSPALNAQYVAAQRVHQQRVTAGICGSTFNGLLSGDWLGLSLGGAILPHKSKENDGVVEFQSCIGDLPPAMFAEDYANKFYRAKLNHADTTFKNGDAWFDKAQKPVKWFECLAL